jgi:CheY-like chemotaxis protein
VIKGIERKLQDADYTVETLENFELIPNRADRTDLFIAYLPTDVMDDVVKRESLKRICELISASGSKMIVIGESKYQSEIKKSVPQIGNYLWMNRPIETEVLIPTIEDTIAGVSIIGEMKRILIVDDDPSYAGMVREWIKDDFQTDIVTAGMQAIKFLLKKPVDMILLDYEMPVVDGPQVLQMLRQEPATEKIPIIFLTGVGTKEAVQRVMALKPEGYILKSTTRDNLLKFLHGKLG